MFIVLAVVVALVQSIGDGDGRVGLALAALSVRMAVVVFGVVV